MANEPSGDEPNRGESLLDRMIGAASWIWLALVGVIVGGVVLRTVFGVSRIELEELQWHLYAFGFLAGIVGCVLHDRHVRVDVFREDMAARRRDWVDLYGLLLFQIPFLVLVFASAIPLVAESWSTAERSTSAGGLPHRWLFKSALPLALVGLFVATQGQLRRVARRLFDPPKGSVPPNAESARAAATAGGTPAPESPR